MTGIRKVYGLASLVSLIIGIGIYFFFRDISKLLIFAWIPKIENFKGIFFPIKHSILSSFFLYNLPDALWFLSGILLLRFIWLYSFKEQNIYLFCFYIL